MEDLLLIKYINQHCSSEEIAKVEAWIRADPSNEVYFDKLQKVWQLRGAKESAPNVDAAWNKVRASIRPVAKTRSIRPMLWRSAAAILLLFSLTMTWIYLKPQQEQLVNSGNSKASEALILADGSKVWLNKNSSLRFPKRFDHGERKVFLEGEAFFEIQRDTSSPFIVESQNTQTRVLGTSFNIMAYPDSLRHWILVKNGRVSFSSKNSNTQQDEILNKGEGAYFNIADQSLKRFPAYNENWMAWNSGTIQFVDSPLDEVVQTLSIIFKEKVILQNKALANCRLNTTYENESLEEILTSISLLFDLKKTENNNVITLDGEACAEE